VIGTRGHSVLETFAPIADLSELPVEGEDLTGRMDLLEHVGDDRYWITDTKTWGSYPVAKAIGLVKKTRPAVDEHGKPVLYQKSGTWGKAGDQKKETFWEVDPSAADTKDAQMQLNGYRVLLQEAYGVKSEKLRVFAIVRDGNTVSAKGRGLDRNTYMIWIPLLPDSDVVSYFEKKSGELVRSIEAAQEDMKSRGDADRDMVIRDNMPAPCTPDEAWNGNRCKGYCPVAMFCAQHGNPYITPLDLVSESDKEE